MSSNPLMMALHDISVAPSWVAAGLVALGFIVSASRNRLAPQPGRRGQPWRSRLLNERFSSEQRGSNRPAGARPTSQGANAPSSGDPAVEPPPTARQPASATPKTVPVHVVVAALIFGTLAVVLAAIVLRSPSRQSGSAAVKSDSAAAADTALDIGWRSGRMDGKDCIGTFEVKRGAGTPAQFVAFVMDSGGSVIAQDSAGIPAVVRGVLVDFRFRQVNCARIADWQLQAATPK